MSAALLVTKFSELFLASGLTEFEWLLLELITLAGHSGLVCEDTRCRKYDTVDWDIHAGLDLQDITDHDVTDVKSNFLAITDALYLFKIIKNVAS